MAIKIEDTFNPISSGAGILSSIIGAISARKQLKQQIRAQSDENQKTRQYNLMLAQLQNQWNLEQWNRENAFNDPSAVVSRLKNAGLNPNLALGNMSLESAASPAMTSGEPSSPQDMSPLGIMPTIGDAALRGVDTALKISQMKNIQADTDKKVAETKGQVLSNEVLKSDAKFRDQMNQTNLEFQKTKIHTEETLQEMYKGNVELARKQIDNLDKVGDKLVADTQKVRAEIAVLNEEQKIKSLEAMFKSETFDLEVKRLVSETSLNYATAKAALMNATTNALVGQSIHDLNIAKERLTWDEHEQANLVSEGIRIQNDKAAFDLKMNKRYGDAQQIVGMTTSVVDSAARLCSGIGSITSFVSSSNNSVTKVESSGWAAHSSRSNRVNY